jgi:DNA-binding beta-propeller fold protein YncE
VVDIEASPPKLIGKVDVGGHTNGLSINREGTLLLAAAHDGTVKVLGIDGKNVKLLDQVKVGEKRLSGISFTHDGKAAIVAQRDENGAAVLSIDGMAVKLTTEKISTGVTPYAVDVSSDGKWAVIGNTGVSGMLGLVGRTVGDADVVTLVDVSKRPFRAVQQISVPSTPEGVAISPDGRWIAVSCMAGSNLTTDNVGRNKIGTLLLFEIKDGWANKINEVAGAEAAQGVVFSQDGKQILLQMDVERAIGVFAVRDGKLVDTGERLKLAAGPVSIRSMPR